MKSLIFCLSHPRYGLFKICTRPFLTPQIFDHQCANMSQLQNSSNVIAVCQLTAKNIKEDNFNTCKHLVESATAQGAKMIFLPEAFDFIGESKKETLELAEPINGPTVQKYRDLAKQFNVWLSLGGVHEKETDETIRNTHLIINNGGAIVASYQKIHLFDVDIPEKNIRLKESDIIKKGTEIIPPVTSPVGKIGLGICYDVRFPELSLMYSKMGAQILTFPSAFTFQTGALHWEVLLRSRAIENQCYVVAAAQIGVHNKKRSSWGHAMVVDPLGNVIAQCSEGASFSLATIDFTLLEHVRITMPVHQHRRCDLYPEMVPLKIKECSNKDSIDNIVDCSEYYAFGQSKVSENAVFYKTYKTMAFTNKHCVLPGHVLVAPLRVVQRLCDMTETEISDMFNVVQHVQNIVEEVYGAKSSTITVQDGPDAGQTIKHVHVHILPRKPGDFLQNDQVYYELQKHDKEADGNKKWRSEEEMASEANILKSYSKQI